VGFSGEIKNPPYENVNMWIFRLARENPHVGGFIQVGVRMCDLNWAETKIHRARPYTNVDTYEFVKKLKIHLSNF